MNEKSHSKDTEPKWFAIPAEKFPSEWLNHKDIGKMNWSGHHYILVPISFLQHNPTVARQIGRKKHQITELRVRLPHLRQTKKIIRNLRRFGVGACSNPSYTHTNYPRLRNFY